MATDEELLEEDGQTEETTDPALVVEEEIKEPEK